MPYSVNILEPKDLQVQSCTDCKKFGFVANPKYINLDQSKALHIIGFMGEDKNKQYYNVNADEISLAICKQQNIDEVIFITGTGGILDNSGNIISEISKASIKKIINNTYKNVSVAGGMQKKCMEILELLRFVSRIVMTSSEKLKQELFTTKGAGTLIAKELSDT